MKQMKKLTSILLALMMLVAMSATAFAADNGSITITNATVGETYTVYKVFDATYSGTAVAYTATAEQATALSGDNSPFTFTATTNADVYNVSVADGTTGETIAAYLENHTSAMTQVASQVAESENVTFSSLDYGYYYVTSSVGSVVTINSATPTVSIEDKNEAPTVDKQVSSDGTNYGDSNTASIGDTIYFETTISAKKGATNYELTDTLSTGLTLNQNSIVVTVGDDTLTAGTEYSITSISSSSFVITFAQSYLDTLTADTTDIVVTYNAILNESAVVGNDGNTNSTYLEYGNNSKTTSSTTNTYTYSFDLVKTTNSNAVLEGAEFTLSDGDAVIHFVKVDDTTYRVATADEITAGGTTTTIAAGSVTISGLGNGTYTLTETKAPDGYNKLTAPVTVTIADSNNSATLDGTTYVSGGMKVVNEAGSTLPSTGGMGTTVLYAAGGILVAGAALALILRRRSSGAEK